jgi:Skp family chaperone for outer membrane proteins
MMTRLLVALIGFAMVVLAADQSVLARFHGGAVGAVEKAIDDAEDEWKRVTGNAEDEFKGAVGNIRDVARATVKDITDLRNQTLKDIKKLRAATMKDAKDLRDATVKDIRRARDETVNFVYKVLVVAGVVAIVAAIVYGLILTRSVRKRLPQ